MNANVWLCSRAVNREQNNNIIQMKKEWTYDGTKRKKAWSIGVVVARFLTWYKTDNSGVMPTPSNAQWFWMGIIAITAITVKILQELNLIGIWVIS